MNNNHLTEWQRNHCHRCGGEWDATENRICPVCRKNTELLMRATLKSMMFWNSCSRVDAINDMSDWLDDNWEVKKDG